MKKIWALFSVISLALPLHGMQLQLGNAGAGTGDALISAITSDNVRVEVTEGILKTSGTLRSVIKDCDESEEEIFLGKSSEEFQLIFPFLKSVYESEEEEVEAKNLLLQYEFAKKNAGEVARIIELANFFDVPRIIDGGSVELKKRLDVLCRQPQGNFEGAIKSFLESVKPLSVYASKLVAGKIIKNHSAKRWVYASELSAKRWLFESCNISSKTLCDNEGYIESLCFSPDGNYLAAGSGCTVKLWDGKTGQCVKTLTGHTHSITLVCWSPDGNYLVTGSDYGTVKLWDVKTNQCVHTCVHMLDGHRRAINSVCFSPDGNYFATLSDSGMVKLWDVKTNQCVHTCVHTYVHRLFFGDYINSVCFGDYINSVCFSPDGNYFATLSNSGMVKLWGVKTNQCVYTLDRLLDRTISVCFSPDGNCLATVSDFGTVKLWDVKTPQCVHTLADHTGCIRSVCFSPDGNYLATITGSGEKTARILNVETGQYVKILTGHTDKIDSVVFSPNGNYLATVSGCTVKLWDVKTNQCVHTCVHTLYRLLDKTMSVCFSPDGNCLATVSVFGTVKLWDLGYFNELIRFLSRDLTLEQAVVLMVFYRNRDNESFGCPEYLAEQFESLPDNIKKQIQSFREEQKGPFYSRMMWRCKSIFSKVAAVINLKNYSDQSSERTIGGISIGLEEE